MLSVCELQKLQKCLLYICAYGITYNWTEVLTIEIPFSNQLYLSHVS